VQTYQRLQAADPRKYGSPRTGGQRPPAAEGYRTSIRAYWPLGKYTWILEAALPGRHTLKLYISLNSDQATVLV
jgi:hypothetical protein